MKGFEGCWKRARVWLVAVVMCGGLLVGRPAGAADEPTAIGLSPLGSLSGATGWLNTQPLTAKDLKGKVVLVDFWDYSCINCIRAVPYVRAWSQKYKDAGLVVLSVHAYEFDVEKQTANVQRAAQKFGITYPIAIDNDRKIWRAFHNAYWPAHYFLDGSGKVRYEDFGEGDYDKQERWIQSLLKENSAKVAPGSLVQVHGQGVQAAADMGDVNSPETYVGYYRAKQFASPGGLVHDAEHLYALPAQLSLNNWGLAGRWADEVDDATLKAPGGKIAFRFHARDLHMVLGPGAQGKPVRFRVLIDGHAPGASHGVDTDAAGNGTVQEHRLYQLVRQGGAVKDHTFTVEFEDAGVQAFSFTFG